MSKEYGHHSNGNCLTPITVVILLLAGGLGYATYTTGGISHVSPNGQREVLGAQGWRPAGQSTIPGAPTPAIIIVVVEPTSPPVRPTAIPQPTAVPAPTCQAPAPLPTQPKYDSQAWQPENGPSTTRYTSQTNEAASPWTILGWLLVVLVPTTAAVSIILTIRRHRATMVQLHAMPGATTAPGDSAEEQREPRIIGSAEKQSDPVAAPYLPTTLDGFFSEASPSP